MSTFILTCGLTIGYLTRPGAIESFSWAYDHWCPLISTCLAFALIQNLYFWAQSYWSGELLALGGNSGYFVYDVRVITRFSIAISPFKPTVSCVRTDFNAS